MFLKIEILYTLKDWDKWTNKEHTYSDNILKDWDKGTYKEHIYCDNILKDWDTM